MFVSLAAMAPAGEIFSELAQAIMRRFCVQNSLGPPGAAVLRELGDRLWSLVQERGLPRPLDPGDEGKPGDLPDAECSPLVTRLLDGATPADREKLGVPARQLVKACFHPEFKVCRDSFREVSPDGACRRQQLARVRARISGAHCIDCPYWVALEPAAHGRFLAREWQATGQNDLAANLDIFLPEDFRNLRRLLYAEAGRRI
jgi:hypothetical protein